MNIEHLALNVNDPDAMREWYVKHLGMRVARHVGGPAHTWFLADESGHTVLEIYNNTAAPVPDYAAMDPLLLHIALATDDMESARTRLIAAGATPQGDVGTTPAGDQLAFLRDPWGLVLQLAKRQKPIL